MAKRKVIKDKAKDKAKEKTERKDEGIMVDEEIAYNINILDYNKKITLVKSEASRLEAEKAGFIYNYNWSKVEAADKQRKLQEKVNAEITKESIKK